MKNTVVSIIMGSDSDLPIMQEAAQILEDLGVAYECSIVSAHRTPDRMYEFAKTAEKRGIQVIIAGAGGAAHLPGMVASLTNLPVIGVPVQSKTLNGVDSLYSIVQMPPGIPVATVAINGAKNAGILAAQVIALQDQKVKANLVKYKEGLREMVEEKAAKLEAVGYESYLSK
ncbi:N5-carboxyaminoimidazole ribonucleotide mutase PurE [Clostridium aceticum]|uniref:N5-carboxyaminoimidazole ribonucleotide mutase n=1 Tax=Clostridium aceticum TaxID=84022 RepID=A0A0D8IEM4_9CLOT|nr:5-(carboxyamino)imidazole ribonucleotide mutase [Clostridium aceticum]AKL93882.1 N5-carboxyaminoimidazole ribonucleotide mutase PurE [Clostridium aceticum]KJF28723.1 N5-carboxyaminoimidazole ribonucleotide mutase [Clostridium aceticum]